jgi:hypothetical protein
VLYNELKVKKFEESCASSLNENETSKKGLVKESQINNSYNSCCQSEVSFMFSKSVKQLNQFIDNSLNNNNQVLSLKDEFFDKNLQSADLVTESATRTSCFTKK